MSSQDHDIGYQTGGDALPCKCIASRPSDLSYPALRLDRAMLHKLQFCEPDCVPPLFSCYRKMVQIVVQNTRHGSPIDIDNPITFRLLLDNGRDG